MQFVHRHWIFLTSLILLCYLLVFSLQGFDLTDEGYMLYSYQNFFQSPQSVLYAFGMYLTVFVGGLWEKMFGGGGWYSFRVLNSIIIVIAYISLCYCLRKYWKYKWILFASFLIVVLSMNVDHGTLVFHYYTFSGFTNTIIGCLIYKGFEKNNQRILFFSSVLLSLNIFVRIPNLTLCVIPYVMLFVSYWYEKNINNSLRSFITITLGQLTGLFVMVALIYLLGHNDLILNKLFELTNVAQDDSDAHGISAMLRITFTHLKFIVIYMAFYLITLGMTFLLYKQCKSKFLRLTFQIIACCMPIVAYYFLPAFIHPLSPRMTFLLATAYIMLILICLNNGQKDALSISVIFFLISVLQPLGSDGWIGNMGAYSIWGLIPVAFVLFLASVENTPLGQYSRPVVFSIILLLLVSIGKNVYKYCYRDEGDRWAKNYQIEASSLATVKTSESSGESLNDLLLECKKHFKEGDTVFFALDVPGLYYLTQTKAWLGKPWPMLLNDRVLKSELKKNGKLGRVVVVERDPHVFNSSAKSLYNSRYSLVNQFLKDNNYTLVWKNDTYRIYK